MKHLLSIFIVFIFVACSSSQNSLTTSQNYSYINGKIIEKFDNKLIVKIDKTDILKGDTYSHRLTNKVIKSSYLIINSQTSINGIKAKVSDIRVDEITFDIDTKSFVKEQDIKIYIPKKSIAVMDFSIINSNRSEINKFAMEDMTTKLVQSGQYKVLERAKLNAVLKEQELVDSGLLDVDSSSIVGKLVSADIILTGSFSKKSNYYMANLRLVDVKTGVILSAINDEIPISEFRVEQLKDISNLSEDFENEQLSNGWNKNLVNTKFSKSKGFIDKTQGANGTSSSFRFNYNFKKAGWTKTQFQNTRYRDVSAYKGIEFFAKADNNHSTIRFILQDKNYNDAKQNKWTTPINITNRWKKYKINFDDLGIGTQFTRISPGGDGKLDLDSVSKIGFDILARENDVNTKRKIWIDEVTLY